MKKCILCTYNTVLRTCSDYPKGQKKINTSNFMEMPCLINSASVPIRVRSCMYVRLRPCPYVCIRALASASVRVCASAFVCVHIIRSPDASARIISDASGCVFRSRTFEMHYKLPDFISHMPMLYTFRTISLLQVIIECHEEFDRLSAEMQLFGGHLAQ